MRQYPSAAHATIRIVELRLTWPLPTDFLLNWEREGEDPMRHLDGAPGFTEADLDRLRGLAPDGLASVRAEPGSVGKGAAGYGITLVFEVLGVVGGVAGLIQTGEYALKIIRWVRAKTGGGPAIRDPASIGAVAAASADEKTRQRLLGYHYVGTVPITASPGVGTDARDIWAACFDGEGTAHLIFVSPSGLVLGEVSVPAEYAFIGGEWRQRTAADVAAWWTGQNTSDSR